MYANRIYTPLKYVGYHMYMQHLTRGEPPRGMATLVTSDHDRHHFLDSLISREISGGPFCSPQHPPSPSPPKTPKKLIKLRIKQKEKEEEHGILLANIYELCIVCNNCLFFFFFFSWKTKRLNLNPL